MVILKTHVLCSAFAFKAAHNIGGGRNKVFTPSSVPSPSVNDVLLPVRTIFHNRRLLHSSNDDSNNDAAPSDVDTNNDSVLKSKNLMSESEAGDAKMNLMLIASATDRGQIASSLEKDAAMRLIETLESGNTCAAPASLSTGTWELVYSSTQLFRSSPFFMAGRAVCSTPDQAQQYDWFCDMHRAALAISTIGKVRQIISPERMTSEFEVKVGAIPFLSDFTPFAYSGGWPVVIEGSIVSSADVETIDGGKAWELHMDTVEIKGSNLPGLRQVLDQGLKLQSRGLAKVLEDNVPNYETPKPVFKTTYLDNLIRISRDQDDKVFVYRKISEDMEPTNYSSVMSDLGIAKLLEGFNDAVAKVYI
jgi:hypothetical protein